MRTAPARTVAGLAALLIALVTGLTGCSGSKAEPKADAGDRARRRQEEPRRHPGVRIVLSTPALPPGVSGLLAADGVGTHAPAFSGAIKVSASGVTADAGVVAVDGTVYAKLPFTSKFTPIKPGRLRRSRPGRADAAPTAGCPRC